jgi:hypothetical protein
VPAWGLKVKMEQLFTPFAASCLQTIQLQYCHVAGRHAYDFHCSATLQHKFAAAATITDQATKKGIKMLK